MCGGGAQLWAGHGEQPRWVDTCQLRPHSTGFGPGMARGCRTGSGYGGHALPCVLQVTGAAHALRAPSPCSTLQPCTLPLHTPCRPQPPGAPSMGGHGIWGESGARSHRVQQGERAEGYRQCPPATAHGRGAGRTPLPAPCAAPCGHDLPPHTGSTCLGVQPQGAAQGAHPAQWGRGAWQQGAAQEAGIGGMPLPMCYRW